MIAEYKDKVLPFLKKYWWAILVLLLIRKYLVKVDLDATYGVVHTLLLFFTLIGMAYVLPKLNIKTDISYGIYIYHMTIINAMIALGYSTNKWLLAVVLLITCFLAWLSTITIGKYSLRRKYK